MTEEIPSHEEVKQKYAKKEEKPTWLNDLHMSLGDLRETDVVEPRGSFVSPLLKEGSFASLHVSRQDPVKASALKQCMPYANVYFLPPEKIISMVADNKKALIVMPIYKASEVVKCVALVNDTLARWVVFTRATDAVLRIRRQIVGIHELHTNGVYIFSNKALCLQNVKSSEREGNFKKET